MREWCPLCYERVAVVDGRFARHGYTVRSYHRPGDVPTFRPACVVSGRKVGRDADLEAARAWWSIAADWRGAFMSWAGSDAVALSAAQKAAALESKHLDNGKNDHGTDPS
jgi:hypothetical protein